MNAMKRVRLPKQGLEGLVKEALQKRWRERRIMVCHGGIT